MNYHDLCQISEYLKQYNKINKVYRVNDNCLCFEFKDKIYFDLTKGKSAIYQGKIYAKNYNSSFDLQLKKWLFNARIIDIKVPKNNRILEFFLEFAHAYKKLNFYFVLEFSGKFTNALILDENRVILHALRYGKNSYRDILQNEIYKDLEETKITEKYQKIDDFNMYFSNIFNSLQEAKLKQLKDIKIAQIRKKIEQTKAILDALPCEKELSKNAEFEYKKGEILKANLHNLKDYERNFTLENIEFNLIFSPKIELQNIFKNAKKLAQKAKNINIEKENLLAKINQQNALIQAIISTKDETFLRSLFAKNKRKKEQNHNANIEVFYVNDYKISVGLNENANAALLKSSKKNDLWFHLKDMSGSHTIISANKQKFDIDIIYHAACLCACYSGKKNGNFLVDFTTRANVSPVQKAQVNYIKYDTIKVFL